VVVYRPSETDPRSVTFPKPLTSAKKKAVAEGAKKILAASA